MEVCRLCATLHENVLELFSEGSELRDKLVQNIFRYLGLEYQDDGILPNWLCGACQLEAESTEKFLLLVQGGQKKLQQMFNVYKEQENCQKLQETLSENIVNKNSPRNSRTNLKKKVDGIRKCKIKPTIKRTIQANENNKLLHSKRLRRPPKRLIEEIEDQSNFFPDSTSTVITYENEDNACAIITSQPIAELRSSAGVPLAEIIEIEPTKNGNNNPTNCTKKVFLICEYCKEAFRKESTFLKHLETHQNSIYQCAQCLKSFAIKSEFDQHQKELQHTGMGIIEKPKILESSVNENINLPDATINIFVGTNGQITSIDSTHLKAAHVKVANDAEVNSKTMDANGSESIKTTNCNPEDLKKLSSQFACLKCQKTFKDHYAVRRHYNQVHIAKRDYKCNQCDASFKNKSNYAYHMIAHTGRKFHKCEQCEKSFILKHQLTLHMRIHSGEKPFQCEKCFKTFTHRSNMVVHQRLHTGFRPFKCEKCDATFSSSSHYKKHQQMHLKQAVQLIKQQINSENMQMEIIKQNSSSTHACEQISTPNKIVGKANSILIAKKSIDKNLNNSSQSLIKENVLANDVVSKSIQLASKHLHELPQITRVDILPPIDNVCNYEGVGNEKELQNHDSHTLTNSSTNKLKELKTIYRFQCHNCFKNFQQKSSFTKHMRTHTGDKPYKCPSCPKCFADPSNFKKHKTLHKNATDELKNVTAKMRKIKAAKHSPARSEAASDPDPDGLETLQRVNIYATECGNYDDDDVDDNAEAETQYALVNTNMKNQLVCVSYQDPTNPVDNKMTTFYVVN